eukprot:TRINITY_DN2585_c0_g3_i1.p1 TRINITY_DN2585_c0_g3~~TRINITY_DN2585_c0_g3_i1.p1  ORF type:complete len:881 (-),score=200.45 TRINITY_DN2585_c0_g3_i1:213-2855(-)
MQHFVEAAQVLCGETACGQLETRQAADLWLRRFQRQPEAWDVAQGIVEAEPSQGIPLSARILAAQTLRSKVLLDLDQIAPSDHLSFRERLVRATERSTAIARAVVVQCALALADLILLVAWDGALAELLRLWGSNAAALLPLLEVLAAVIEERGHPLLPPSRHGYDDVVHDAAPMVAAWLQTLSIDSLQPPLQCALLRCRKRWMEWAPPSADWIHSVVACLGREDGGVGEEAADTLVEAAVVADALPDSHEYLAQVVCAAVAPLLERHTQTDDNTCGGGSSRALRVAAQAAEPMLPAIAAALRQGHPDAEVLLRVLAKAARSDLCSAAFFFSSLASAVERDPELRDNSFAVAAFHEVLRCAVRQLQQAGEGDSDALDLCEAAARGLGHSVATQALLQLPMSSGRTWALSVVLPTTPEALPNGYTDDALLQGCWAELERAVGACGAADAALLRQAGKWLATKPTALPVVLGALIQRGHDVAAHAIVVDCGPAAAPCTALLAGAAAGRPTLGSAAVYAARELGPEDFKAAMDRLTLATTQSSEKDTAGFLRGMADILAGLRGLERCPVLGAAAVEAISRVGSMAWSVLLQEAAMNGAARRHSSPAERASRSAAVDVLRLALQVGRPALPSGDLPSAAARLAASFQASDGATCADALALLLREFGGDEDAQAALALPVATVARAGLQLCWDAAFGRFRDEGVDHLDAAWAMMERAVRYAPNCARGLCSSEHQRAACCALATLHPALVEPSMSLLVAWLEDESCDATGVEEARERAWKAIVAAVREVPPPGILDQLPSVLEGLRDCKGPPRNLLGLLQEAFGSCASGERLEAAAATILEGEERDIALALHRLAHSARRLATQRGSLLASVRDAASSSAPAGMVE